MRRVVPSVAAAGFLVLFVRLASAQTTGAVSGTVTSSADATPIGFATVSAYDANRSIVSTVSTDASGAYAISNLAPGTYYLRFSRDGFVPVAFNNVPCAAQSCFSNGVLGLTPTPVVVTAGSTTTVNVALDRGATISGTITRAVDGAAEPLVLVRLYDASTSPVATVTAVNGAYSFTGLPYGTYYARTDRAVTRLQALDQDLDVLYGGTLCPGGATPRCRIDSGAAIVVSGVAPSATANFSLPAGGSIRGSVLTLVPGPRPFYSVIPWAPVLLYAGSTQIGMTQADSSGIYRFSGLDPATYFVRTNVSNADNQWYFLTCVVCPGTHPTPLGVSAGAESEADFIVFPAGGGISGTLTLDQLSTFPPFFSRPTVQLPEVQIYNTDGTLVQTAQLEQGIGNTVQWSVSGLFDGTYYVRTSSYSLPPFLLAGIPLPPSGLWVDKLYDNKACVAADCDPRLGTPVVVAHSVVTTGIDFSLDLGAQITGTLDAGFESGATLVEVYDARGVRLPQRSGTQAGDATSHGYGALGLPAGTYYLVATSLATGVRRVLYNGMPCEGCPVTSGTPVTVSLGEHKAGIDFAVIADRKISGTIRSDSSANPPNQLLSTISVEAYAANGQLVASTTTLADGTYTIRQLTAGTFSVRTRNTRGFVDQTYGSSVVIPADADVSGIDFSLVPGQTVSGQVLASDGSAIAAAGVTLYASSPASPAARVSTDASGFYQTALPAGSFFAQTDPIPGYQQQIYKGIACPQGTCPTGSATQVPVASTALTGIDFNLPSCQPLTITPVRLANAAVGIAYRQTLLVSAAAGAVGLAVSGTLPPGLTFDSTTGVLSGTPTAAGQFTFMVSAVDGRGCATSRTYTLDVPACTFPGPSVLSVPAMGVPSPSASTGTLILQSCEDPAWRAAIDVPWVHGEKLPVMHPAPDGTLLHWAIAFSVDPNTSGASRTGHVTYGSHALTVLQSGATASAPFGSVDAPHTGDVVSGSIAIGGWALDDVSVSQVQIYRDPVPGEPSQPIFIGNATFVTGSRPDVESAFRATPFNTRAGWGYLLLTNMLPNRGNGVFNIYAYATDADGNRTLLGVRTITAVNASATAPFGAIDTPDQGATVSGTGLVNFGWALTPQPKMIPFDGSTIHVMIDGVDVGTVAAYNLFRSDVSGLFPDLKNSGGPVGYRIIDTTSLSDGQHTIAWLATDDGGITTGIGSRFFTVQNSAWQPSLRADFLAPAASPNLPPAFSDTELTQANATTTIPPRVDGVDLGRNVESLASLPIDVKGARTVGMSNLQALELSLTPAVSDTCPETYAGYLLVRGELRALPVGSSLDPAGTFYWHPGTAFFGTYQLLFVRTSCDGTRRKIPVAITIH